MIVIDTNLLCISCLSELTNFCLFWCGGGCGWLWGNFFFVPPYSTHFVIKLN